jgi:hypothetical protein
MTAHINEGNVQLDVESLRAGNISDQSITVSGWDRGDEHLGETWSYYEAYKVPVDGFEEPFVMINRNGIPHVVIIAGTAYDYDEFEDYFANRDDDNSNWLAEQQWDRLFDADPSYQENSSDGPAMNYWYPCESVEDDPVEAAYILRGTPLCVVEVDGNWGLALSGGGMDLSWEIVEAYVLLGQLPPTHFADLPGMAGRGASEADRKLVQACLRSMEVAADRLRWNRERLVESAGTWAARA